ncbi:MAG: O-antigen ligase family protein [Rubrobacter sp.]
MKRRSLKQSVGNFLKGRDRLPPTLGLVCVVLLAAWMGNADGGYLVGGWAPPALVLAALVLLVSVTGFFVRTRLRWGALALGLLTAYTAWTFVSLLWSPNKGEAWLGAGQTLLYLLAFWATIAFVTLGASRRWALAASVLGPAAIAAFTLQSLGPRINDLFANDRLIGTVGYYNGEAAFLLVSFWVAVYLGGSPRVNPLLRAAVLAGAVLSADLAILTQSRGAMVAMAVSVPIFFLLSGQRLRGMLALAPVALALYAAFPGLNGVYLAFLQGGDPAAALDRVLVTVWATAAGVGLYGLCWGLLDRRWTLPKVVGRVAGGVALVAVAVLLVAGATVLAERTGGDPAALAGQKWEAFKTNDRAGQDQSRYLSASGSGRYELWEVAWRDFAAHPVLGVGTQNYEATYYQLREETTGSVRQPHMLPLEVLGERGAVGGLLFFGFLGTCVGVGFWGRFSNLGSEGKAQVGALIAAIAYWFVHSGAEWFWQLPAVTLPAFVYLALLVSPWRQGRIMPGAPRWALRASGIGVAALAFAVVVPLYAADRYLEKSRAADDPEAALAAVERAQGLNPVDPRLPEREAALAIDIGDWGRAEGSYEKAIRLNPEHYAPYMYRATFHERRGELDEALLYYRKAHALNPIDEELGQSVSRLRDTESGPKAVSANGKDSTR